MPQRFAPLLRRTDMDDEMFFDVALAHVLGEHLRPECGLERIGLPYVLDRFNGRLPALSAFDSHWVYMIAERRHAIDLR